MNLFIYFFQNYGYRNFDYQQPWYEQWYETIIDAPLMSITFGIIILVWVFKQRVKDSHSHWNTLLDNFSYSTQEFYELLRKELKSHGVKEMEMTNKNLCVDGMCLTRRRYLRITWKDYQYYICAAPFGNGFFISWHLIYNDSPFKLIVSKIPFVGQWLVNKLFHITFYKTDTASMFMTYAHQSVLNVVEQISNEKGVRKLSESERKPMVHNFHKR